MVEVFESWPLGRLQCTLMMWTRFTVRQPLLRRPLPGSRDARCNERWRCSNCHQTIASSMDRMVGVGWQRQKEPSSLM